MNEQIQRGTIERRLRQVLHDNGTLEAPEFDVEEIKEGTMYIVATTDGTMRYKVVEIKDGSATLLSESNIRLLELEGDRGRTARDFYVNMPLQNLVDGINYAKKQDFRQKSRQKKQAA